MNLPGVTSESDPLLAFVALLEDDAVQSVYQPIVRLLDGAVVGYEALARMSHLPYRPPDHWLAIAEEAGLVREREPHLTGRPREPRRSRTSAPPCRSAPRRYSRPTR